MIITIDFDETLFPTLQKVMEIYNRQYNDTLSLEQITTYNLYECLDSSVADTLLDLFVKKEVYDNLQPYKGAVKAIKSLIDRGHEIYIATATDIRNLEWKEQLLQRYFPFIPKNNLIRIHQKKLLKTDILIEDNLNHLMESFADRVCFNHPWNQNDIKDYVYGIRRMYSWSDITNIINDIEKEMKKWEKQ